MALPHPRLIAAGVALVLAFAAGWAAQGWRKDAQLQTLRAQHASTLQAIADKTDAARAAVQKQERMTAAHLAELDRQKTKEIVDAKLETDRLRRCIAAGTCGVRINTAPGTAIGYRPADAAAPGVGDAAAALNADVQRRILDLRDTIAADAAALGYLQGYALQCSGGAPGAHQ